MKASLTGQLVFSTLHTNDAAGALTRLVDMGVEPFLIATSLEGVLGQRLVRKICTNCKESYEPPVNIRHAVERLRLLERLPPEALVRLRDRAALPRRSDDRGDRVELHAQGGQRVAREAVEREEQPPDGAAGSAASESGSTAGFGAARAQSQAPARAPASQTESAAAAQSQPEPTPHDSPLSNRPRRLHPREPRR